MGQKQWSNGGCIFLLCEVTIEARHVVAPTSFLHLLQISRPALSRSALGGALVVTMLPLDTEQACRLSLSPSSLPLGAVHEFYPTSILGFVALARGAASRDGCILSASNVALRASLSCTITETAKTVPCLGYPLSSSSSSCTVSTWSHFSRRTLPIPRQGRVPRMWIKCLTSEKCELLLYNALQFFCYEGQGCEMWNRVSTMVVV